MMPAGTAPDYYLSYYNLYSLLYGSTGLLFSHESSQDKEEM